MGIGKIDPEYAVREGWARDQDDEIYMDGYNAFIQISTRDGTSGFSVKNDLGTIAFSSKSDGDGYFAKRLGIGTYFPQTEIEVIGKTRTDQLQVTENATAGYILTADTDGNATWQAAGAGADVKVKVSSNDTTAGYLLAKLVAGTSITLTEVNDGGNETIRIDAATGSAATDGYLKEEDHRPLDELVHLISEDSYEEVIYDAANKVSSMIIYTDSGKTTKIREEQYTYSSGKVSQILSIQYDSSGVEVERMTEDFTYSGIKVTSIIRDVTLS